MDIPINVKVICETETCGHTTNLIVNPVNDQVTHVVVAEKAFPNIERLVPVKFIVETSPTFIRLNCDAKELTKMDPFMETDFINADNTKYIMSSGNPYMLWPYGLHEAGPIPLEHKHIPAGEVAIHRGTPVNATDGRVGKVDEFLVDPECDEITHLVLREGHLWGQKDVTIPVSEIDKISDEAVSLKLDKHAIERLPAIPITRKWH